MGHKVLLFESSLDLSQPHFSLRGQLRLAKEDWAGGVQDLEEAYSLQPSPQVIIHENWN